MRRSPSRPDRLWPSAVVRDHAQETGWVETGCRWYPDDSGVLEPQKQRRILPEEPRKPVPVLKSSGTEPGEAPRGPTPSAEIHLQPETSQQDRNRNQGKPDLASDPPPPSPPCFWRPWRTSAGA